MIPQWQKRLNLTIIIYQYILMEYPKDEVLDIAFNDFEIEKEELEILENVIDNYQELVDKIKPYIESTWTWERMSFFDRAIIVEALSEFIIKKTPKSIIIDQALITARKYSVDSTYKYINAILEKVIDAEILREQNNQ